LCAFGGNVIQKSNEAGTIEQQQANARGMCRQLMCVLKRGYELVVTHGNGPQVGNLLMQNELAKELVPDLPLDVLVAQTEGSLGYILQQELLNELRRNEIGKFVVTMITQVLVDAADPAFEKPTKPVGPFYTESEAGLMLERFKHWRMAMDSNRGFRRIVPSPMPKRVIQSKMIRSLVYAGNVVLALGGGGVPMTKDRSGQFVGVEAVIDKDLSSALLATDIKADLFVVLTGEENVCINFGRENQQALDHISAEEAAAYLRDGQFPPGSMGPKIQSALLYLRNGGQEVIITSPERLEDALDGNAGTRITRG